MIAVDEAGFHVRTNGTRDRRPALATSSAFRHPTAGTQETFGPIGLWWWWGAPGIRVAKNHSYPMNPIATPEPYRLPAWFKGRSPGQRHPAPRTPPGRQERQLPQGTRPGGYSAGDVSADAWVHLADSFPGRCWA